MLWINGMYLIIVYKVNWITL